MFGKNKQQHHDCDKYTKTELQEEISITVTGVLAQGVRCTACYLEQPVEIVAQALIAESISNLSLAQRDYAVTHDMSLLTKLLGLIQGSCAFIIKQNLKQHSKYN